MTDTAALLLEQLSRIECYAPGERQVICDLARAEIERFRMEAASYRSGMQINAEGKKA